MFNRTIVQAPRGPSTVVHHEHRAPTDESVRLLAEMEKAAEAKIIKTIRLEKNGFNAVIQIIKECRSGAMSARCVLSLNGKEIVIEETASIDDYAEDPHALVKMVLATTAKRVAEEIIIPAYAAQSRNISF